MKIGVTLPTFSGDASGVIDAALAAEAAGLYGVFSFDHQWPLGHPERPSLSVYPTLGAVGAATTQIQVGTLVARIGLLPDEVVIASIESLHRAVSDRLIAGLGTGDDASSPEHLRYGLPYAGAASRLERLAKVLGRLGTSGIDRWVGAGSAATNRVAREAGATLNYWGVSPARVAAAKALGPSPVTWGGPLPDDVDEASARLRLLAEAGAGWVVWGWPRSLDLVVEAAGAAGVELAPAGTRAGTPIKGVRTAE